MCRSPQAIAGKRQTRMRRIVVRLQEATTGALPGYVTVVAIPKTGEKTSRLVCHLTEIALTGGVFSDGALWLSVRGRGACRRFASTCPVANLMRCPRSASLAPVAVHRRRATPNIVGEQLRRNL
jgi:hypothetical protein